MHKGKLILLLIPLIALFSCTPEHSKIIVAEFGDAKINMNEFENAYSKNSGGLEHVKTDSILALQKFLDLYVNYKMKLRDADVRGYKKDAEMLKELHDYKINIGTTLFLENTLVDPNVRLMFERRKKEYRASHIFLMADSSMNAQQVETLANQIIDRIQKGEDFAALAKKYSKDTRTAVNGGDVYYFTAGQINNAEIEDAIFSTEVGKIYPKPISTPYGIELIKITEINPRRVSLHLQHILIRSTDSTGVSDTAKALKKIQEIEKEIKSGADFGKLAHKYSDDTRSAQANGDIGYIQRGKTVKEFDQAAFKLKVGEISAVVRTQFGYHLIRLVEETPNDPYEKQKEELKEIYHKYRYKMDYDKLVSKLKTEFNYIPNGETFSKLLSVSDTLKVGPAYFGSSRQKLYGSNELFKINGKSYTPDSLFSYLVRKGSMMGQIFSPKILDDAVSQYSGDLLVSEKALVYDKENPEFAKLLEDYENGMYLFKILEDEVWSKISIDSVKIQKFYNETKQNYKWKDRVEFKEVYVPTDSVANQCYNLALANMPMDSIKAKFGKRTGYENKVGYSGLVEIGFNELAKQANALKNIGDVSKPFKFENGWSIVKLIGREPARLKTFEEASAEASSLLQEKESKRLEEDYMNKLKSIYRPKFNYEELSKAFKQAN